MFLDDFIELLIEIFPQHSCFITSDFALSSYAEDIAFRYEYAVKFDAQQPGSNFCRDWIFQSIGLSKKINRLQVEVDNYMRALVVELFKNFSLNETEHFDWDVNVKEIFACSGDLVKLRKLLLNLGFNVVQSIPEKEFEEKSTVSIRDLLEKVCQPDLMEAKLSDSVVSNLKKFLWKPDELFFNLVKKNVLKWEFDFVNQIPFFLECPECRVLHVIFSNRIAMGIADDPNLLCILLKLSKLQMLNLETCLQKFASNGVECEKAILDILKYPGLTIYKLESGSVYADWLIDCDKAQKEEYHDNWRNLDRFSLYLTDCVAKHVKGHNYLAPYGSLNQSSGHGKSRLAIEYGYRKGPLIYISLGSDGCYPPGNPQFIDLFRYAKDVDGMTGLLCFIFFTAITKLLDIIMKYPGSSEEIDRKILVEFMTAQDIYNKKSDFFPAVPLMHTWESIAQVKGLLKQLAAKFKFVVLSIDESSRLLETSSDSDEQIFLLYRRSMNRIDKAIDDSECKIFGTLSSTASKISNFTGSNRTDPSLRKIPKLPPKLLHPPFYAVNNTDIYFMQLAKKFPHEKWAEEWFFDFAIFFLIGRALWHITLLSNRDKQQKVTDAILLAQAKMIGGRDVSEFVKNPCKEAKLALLLVRVPLTLGRNAGVTEELIASYMKTITSISEDREVFFASYHNDPILAYASEQLSRTYFSLRPAALLESVHELILTGSISTGDLGEQALALMYTVARDQCVANLVVPRNRLCHPVLSVKTFLNSIHPHASEILAHNEISWAKAKRNEFKRKANKQAKLDQQQILENRISAEMDSLKPRLALNLELLLNGEISFSQFVDIENTPSENQLKEAFYKGLAFVAVPCQAGVDLFIPVRIKRDGIQQFTKNEDESTEAARNVFKKADRIFLQKDGSLKKVKDEDVFKSVQNTYSFYVSDYIQGADNYRYTAICIQSKNKEKSCSSEDLGIDLSFAGVVLSSSAKIPCISIKHTLRYDGFEIKNMDFQGKPYRYGLVINGIDNSPNSMFEKEFTDKLIEVLNTSSNSYVHIDTMEPEVVIAGYLNAKAEITQNFGKIPN